MMVQMWMAMQRPGAMERFNLNQWVIEPLLHNLAIVLVILVPAITMRSFAEEKRTGTYELLLTSPVRTGEIVAGKFIGAAVFVLIMITLGGVFSLILVMFVNPESCVVAAGGLCVSFLAGAFLGGVVFSRSLPPP